MKIHEFQAKAIFARFGVPVPHGEVAASANDARDIAKRLSGRVVVKAQIHAGGRGKGGGVKLAASPDEAESIARGMIGMTLVTHQTGPAGRVVNRLLVEEAVEIQKEYYLSLVVDRAAAKNVIMASTEGGMDIEEVAAKTPEKILKAWVDPAAGFQPFVARTIAFGLG
ncbi:MAG TPA: ATP-grasp domain-containing protein, partial [Verrucomicrobiae bacterium]|nr:ATP-grasp domain-containing protein [Verrucomicrobiae bacterium]